MTAGGIPAATEPTAELGRNGVIGIGPAVAAEPRLTPGTTAPATPGGEHAIVTTATKTVTRASQTRTTQTSPWISRGEVSLSK